jgi:hypothetical protein
LIHNIQYKRQRISHLISSNPNKEMIASGGLACNIQMAGEVPVRHNLIKSWHLFYAAIYGVKPAGIEIAIVSDAPRRSAACKKVERV